MSKKAETARAGQDLSEWVADARIGLSTFYTLPEECRPYRTKIGRRVIVYESARDWLARMAARGGVPVRNSEKTVAVA